jgi:hypothetical protein
MIAAVLVVGAVAPAGALAADEESGGSPPGETVVEPSGGSTQPTDPATPSPPASTPASPGWTPQSGGTGATGGGGSSVRHGSSVGSGGVPGKTRSSSGEESSYAPETSTYAPPPSTQPTTVPTPSTFGESSRAPRAETEIDPAQPPAEGDSTGPAVDLGVATATSLASPKPPQSGDVSETPATAAAFTDSGDRSGSGSYALPLLLLIVAGLILGYACVRLWRRHQRRRLEDLRRRRDATWETVVHQIKMDRQLAASEELAALQPSAERQTIDVG